MILPVTDYSLMPNSDPFPSPTPAGQEAPAPIRYVRLNPGDPAPWFRQRSTSNPAYAFDTVAGRHVVLLFFISAGDPLSAAALQAVERNRGLFDDQHCCFFGVSSDADDERQARVRESLPGLRHFWDFDGAVGRAYGALPMEPQPAGRVTGRRFWLVLDPLLRVERVVPLLPGGAEQAELFDHLSRLPPPALHAGRPTQAPVLLLPRVFEPDLCRRLIQHYDAVGGTESGFMREIDGMTRLVTDPGHKRRRDVEIADETLIAETRGRIHHRIAPQIRKAYQFEATRMERYLVGCYTAEDGGHFRPHRDNTTRGTAHRRFAVSINLNDDFEGGDVFFPEFSPEGLVPPPGGAVVFSCSLLHSVRPVTRGRRLAFLPFLYDEPAARIRAENLRFFEGADSAGG
ncbi:MAG: 2OG-Fe(II) oxygenase [Zavarzinia sp.]|nr:2OG-Fe(II) oxygenase [Zavarzinia sp.]